MPNIVVKFGGSNLKDKSDVTRIIKVIENYGERLIVVVSAFYGVTNYLEESLETLKQGEDVSRTVYSYLHALKRDAVEYHITDTALCEEAWNEIDTCLEELSNLLKGIYLTADASPALCDFVLSYGERLSAIFLSYVLKQRELKSVVAYPEDFGLITDGIFANASVDFKKSKHALMEYFKESKIYVVPGFYGISTKGKVTLLGRGGSDYSAAAIAKCVDAKSLDVWKDVEGFLTSDPREVSQAKNIKHLSYVEAAELAYFGAKILHPRCVEPLIEPNISLRLFHIHGASDDSNPLTIIGGDGYVCASVVKSITHTSEFGILKLKGPGVGSKPGILSVVTTAFSNAGININSVLTSQISINFLLHKNDLHRAKSLIDISTIPSVMEIEHHEDVATIAAIGEGLIDNYGIAARIFSSLAEEKINVRMSCSCASPVVSYFIVSETDRTRAIQAMHRSLFEKKFSPK
ncbi:aspartate kinase [Halosquirtibacter laminarini]|uniref:Aspartate kinase n=1 Tax=Halosquirtibacter laminarini TaxID=3374600 RepID=A0AC61NI95_9BACT|nr:aspartate kinase [Prolixibacteraceae bacterium]